MRIEQHHGKLSANMLRLYHSMYQLFTFTMLLALTTNNMGILWVAMEAATLTTVLLVSLYRTPASLEAAWKYFILCGVGIAQALFGTILLYFAAEKLLGAGGNALLWTASQRGERPSGTYRAVAGLRLSTGGLRHQSWPGAAAQLAAGCPCRRPDAGVRGAFRFAAQRRAVRSGAQQGAGGWGARIAPGRQPDDGVWSVQRGGRGVFPVAAKGRQAHVRLLPRSSIWA